MKHKDIQPNTIYQMVSGNWRREEYLLTTDDISAVRLGYGGAKNGIRALPVRWNWDEQVYKVSENQVRHYYLRTVQTVRNGEQTVTDLAGLMQLRADDAERERERLEQVEARRLTLTSARQALKDENDNLSDTTKALLGGMPPYPSVRYSHPECEVILRLEDFRRINSFVRRAAEAGVTP